MSSLLDGAAVLALSQACGGPWYEISEMLEDSRSALAIIRGTYESSDGRLTALAAAMRDRLDAGAVEHWAEALAALFEEVPDAHLVSVIDEDYPLNLRRIYNRPPFLFVRGVLTAADDRAVAVVGTREASSEGIAQATMLAGELARRHVTVISGLAKGVDTAAHTAALKAGGRTVAIMGTGIDRVYPAANHELAERMLPSGALISQFWPGSPPRSQNFPLRNVVTSGIAVGTVVVEASHTSGAKMQARLALEHGKRLFLLRSLVLQEEWARRYAVRPGAVVVDSVEDVLQALDAAERPVDQLALF